MTKQDFFDSLSKQLKLNEDLNQVNQTPGQKTNFLKTITDPTVVKKATDTVTQLTNLKKKTDDLGITSDKPVAEEFDAEKDYGGKVEFYKAQIDHLLETIYGVRYFEGGDPAKLAQRAGVDNDVRVMSAMLGRINMENPTQAEEQLHGIYLTLQDRAQKRRTFGEGLENTEMFRIIAEAENPRLTKEEFLSFLKSKI